MTRSQPPQRILMTADAVGGVWNYALELSRALGRHGVEVVLATMGPRPRPEQRAEAAALPNVALCESHYQLEWMESPWSDLARAGEWLLELERHFRPDVIHLNGYAHGALPWRAPTVVVGHSCVLSWWRAVRGDEPPAEWQRYREMVRTGLHAAGAVVAPSAAMLDALEHEYGPLAHAGVVYNGRETDEFPPAHKQPYVLSVGRLWDEAKNAVALARVAPQLGWPVRLAGDTAPPGGAAGAWPNVELVGRCGPATLAPLYGHAAIYAQPARYEPFGLSVLEAAMAGCALVLGDIPSLREIWGEAARYVPPDDPAALAAALRELIADHDLRHVHALRAYERAGFYTAARMAEGYLDAYAGALHREVARPEPAGVYA